jgi:hypothetical protein
MMMTVITTIITAVMVIVTTTYSFYHPTLSYRLDISYRFYMSYWWTINASRLHIVSCMNHWWHAKINTKKTKSIRHTGAAYSY